MKAAMTSSDEFPVGIVIVESMKAAVASSDEFTGDLLQTVASSEEVTDVAFEVGWPRDFEIGSDLQEDDELPVGSDLQEDNELPIGNDLQEDNELPLAQVRSLRMRDNTQCPPGTTIFMSMNRVGWSQDSIRSQFQDGRDIQSEVNRYLAMSQGERVRALQALPTIRVVGFVEQGWIALDNRRLAVFRSVLAPGTRMPFVIATANEARELINKLTTVNSGTSVVVRSNPRYTINRRVNRM